ncbi:ABC transporter permease [Chitinophaga eiseniae]|uniref:FtsX-like permease family protein n=1 Tax=Chitinophaga eiseniae TaxID=634771 RepID=A0A847SDU2_9BACT|nr:ABC transporter permease [Chitinophaga eiseniae]NLR77943.1 FtsX-like permease family protein [Chitinophaga eiseniae]
MIRNYLKVAWRNLMNSKVYSAINILGLAMGMAVAMIIVLWVVHEYSYDKFLPDHERAYQVRRNFNSNGDTLNFTTCSLKLADALRSKIPEMEYVSEASWMNSHGLMVGDRKLLADGMMVQRDFLRIFPFQLIEGSAAHALDDTYSILLTQSLAESLFGSGSAVGKTLRLDSRHDVRVAGVLKDLPSNSSFSFKYLIPFSYFEQTEEAVRNNRKGSFSGNAYQIFAKLKAGTDYSKVAAKIRDIELSEKDNVNSQNSAVVLQPLDRWHLYSRYENGKDSSGAIDYVRMFGVIGLLVLVIAGINFVNLSTARSEKRAREVGIRKAIGSQRRQLIIQFLTESVLTAFIALLFALLLVQLSLPAFNGIAGRVLHIPFDSGIFWLLVGAGTFLTGVLAGSKPAFFISSFNPVKTLKGTLQSGKSAAFSRKALVIVQFSCSVALIISTLVIYRQMQHARNRPTGYDPNNLIMTRLNEEMIHNYPALKNELLQSGLAQSVTLSTSPATAIGWHRDLDYWPGKLPGETVEMGVILADNDYFKTMGLQLVSGRNFSTNPDSDTANVILNEAAVKRLRLKDPLNELLTMDGQKINIIGVVKNALLESPFAAMEPITFGHSLPSTRGFMMCRFAPGADLHATIPLIAKVFERYNPAFPFDYDFVDQVYGQKFQQEIRTSKLSGIFAVLAILISCLGLFGLAAFTAQQRTKEIGVRKVLGASASQIWVMLSRDFVILVVISCLLAAPLAFYFLQRWLSQYDYRITLGPDVFILAALAAIVITLITVSFQSIKAALVNPVGSLKSE